MKLFGFEFGDKSKKQKPTNEKIKREQSKKIGFHKKEGKFPVITQADKEWVEENFQLAFEEVIYSVDLLELHYSNFLFKQGKTEEAMEYLKMAVEKGEPEAIERKKELENK